MPEEEYCKLHRSFDNLSNIYWILEYIAFGTLLQQARRSSLQVIESRPNARVLILGDGDGRFSCEAILRYPNISIDSLDSSQGMLASAINRMRNADSRVLERYNPILENALTYEYPYHHYDIVVCQFFIDCFASAEANDLIARLTLALKPGGTFSYVDFANPKLQPMKSFSKIVLPALYGFFRQTTALSNRKLPRIVWPGSLSCSDRAEWGQGFVVAESWKKGLAG